MSHVIDIVVYIDFQWQSECEETIYTGNKVWKLYGTLWKQLM